jgi:hypothetical protein
MSIRVRRNLLPCSGLKSPFYPADGGSRFLRNVGAYLPTHIVSSQTTVIFIGLLNFRFLKSDVSSQEFLNRKNGRWTDIMQIFEALCFFMPLFPSPLRDEIVSRRFYSLPKDEGTRRKLANATRP